MTRKKTRVLPLLALVAVVAAGGWAAARRTGGDAIEELKGSEVRRGPLRISVVERGNLKAADSVTLKSEIEGQTTVLYLIEEGTEVQAGDLLCELDISSLQDRKIQQEIQVQNALASYTKAQQNYEIQQSQNLSDIAKAERDLEFAKLDLRKYLEGERPQELQQADEDILLRQEEQTLAEQDLEWSEKLAARGFLEQTQLDADRIRSTRAGVLHEQALRAKELLVAYTIPRQERLLESEVEESNRELDRVKLQAKARIADFDADLATSKAKYDLEEDELEKLESQISKAKIHSPVAGMVVYGVEKSGRWGGGTPMQEGAMVRERQEIITIPSAEGYIAEASLHESVLEKVTTGMPALVTVDALQTTLRAEVDFKAVLPDQNSWFANPDLRVYRTEIRVLDEDLRMRPGMSCSIEILVEDIEDTIYVPVQSVFLDAGKPVALVADGDTVEKRPIEVGPNNGKWVAIHSGVEEGETVLLSQPSDVTLAPAVEEVPEVDTANWPESRPRKKDATTAARGDVIPERSGDAAGGQRAGGFKMDPKKLEEWKKANPEAYERMQEAMKDPEKMKAMREAWKKGGGAGGRSGGDAGGK
jgi:HlyD family secretion protein